MTDQPPSLTPASVEDLESVLIYALRYHGRKRTHTGDEFMARLTAERLVEHLDRCGFVVMRKPAALPHSIGAKG
jgi:hypothetical protein